MSYFGLDPVAERKQLAYAAENPVLPQEAGFFDGVVMAPVNGLVNGLIAKPALALDTAVTEAITPYARMLDNAAGTSTEQWLQEQHDIDVSTVRQLTPNSATTGTAGQILNGLFDMGAQAVVGSRIAGPLGGASAVTMVQGGADYAESREKGVDQSTALQKATVTGLTAGVGTLLPMSIGLRSIGGAVGTMGKTAALGGDIAYSAGSNMAMGMAQRGFTHDILSSAGYEEMARQYQVMDKQALAVDAVLGIAFGGAGHFLHSGTGEKAPPPDVSSAEIDAALTTNSALHVETDAAPGIPADAKSRTVHVNALNKALADISAGRPVDVSSVINDASFIPKDMNNFIRDVSAEVSEFYPDLPLFYLDDGSAVTGKAIDDHIALLEPDAAQLMNRGAHETLAGELHQSEATLESLSTELQNIPQPKGSGKALSRARIAHKEKSTEINQQIAQVKADISAKKEQLQHHIKGGKFYEAKADISRLRQGKVSDRLKQSIARQSAEELNLDLEQTPQRLTANTGRNEVSPAKTSAERSNEDGISAADEDTKLASHALSSNPDMMIHTEDASGNVIEVKAADVMADADAVIKQAEDDASLYEAAIVCFLGGRQ
ncbi:hypothetical protein D5O62_03400 [Salmonella enterica subsp. enterica serovar Warnow]|nr:hypothetical protein [Salmonella enterica subsp. enterica serovar Warnow]HAK9055130.1 hypothetical protein [Salmonella enterica]